VLHHYPFSDPDGSPLVLTLGMDITERRQVEEQLRESEKKARQLASQLLVAQEQERGRISRELHDELGQSLLTMKLQLRAIQRKAPTEDRTLAEDCEEVLAFVDDVVDNVRRLSQDLSPYILKDLGLATALRRLLRKFSEHYQIKLHADHLGNLGNLFCPEAQVHIYRISQECLTNIGKHSGASQLTVVIHQHEREVSLIMEDNGVGFNPEPTPGSPATDRGLGLAAMEERVRILGGSFNLWSQKGRGTKISFTIPVATSDS